MTKIRDVEKRLKAIELENSRLGLALKKAIKANQSKDALLANVSHDMRTPLNGIAGFTALLLESDLKPQQREHLNTIKKSVHGLMAMLNDVLNCSRLEAGQLTFNNQPFNVTELIEDVLAIMMPSAHHKSLELVYCIDKDVPKAIIGDRQRLGQILTNLIGNAIKFTNSGRVAVHVSMKERQHEKQHNGQHNIKFSVTDTGVGIKPEQQSRIFNTFVQADPHHTSHHTSPRTTMLTDGVGLGLAISKMLVTQMRGNIGLSSEPGKGSTFWFTIQAHNTQPVIPEHNKTDKALHILVVDDHLVNLKLMQTVLAGLKQKVSTARSGSTAIDYCRQQDVDLILMDVRMPGLDGIETTTHIRALSPHYSALPIIAMTAQVLPDERQRILNGGMSDYTTKPVSTRDMAKILSRWGHHHSTQQHSNVNFTPKVEQQRSTDDPPATGHEALYGELLTMLLEELPEDLTTISSSFENNDHVALLERVHRLHGACQYCNVPVLKQACYHLENRLKRTNDLTDKNIAQAVKETVNAIKELLTRRAAEPHDSKTTNATANSTSSDKLTWVD